MISLPKGRFGFPMTPILSILSYFFLMPAASIHHHSAHCSCIFCAGLCLLTFFSILPYVTALKSEFPVTDPLSLSLLSNVARKNWGRVFSLMIFIEFGHFPFIYVFLITALHLLRRI